MGPYSLATKVSGDQRGGKYTPLISLQVRELPIGNISFIDVTTNTFTVSIGGDLCNYSIATITPIFELPS
jgi:hypothetical protein